MKTVLQNLPFISDVKMLSGNIYAVGGSVRDSFLNKKSKDLDIVITDIPIEFLKTMLETHGTVNIVGESFGIIKFKAHGETEDIDIAIPRTERKVDKGHTGFIINSDPFLPIEDDLERRDFTINAIAVNDEGETIDPFNGLQDLLDRKIRVIGKNSFFDDPLRMLRAIQFASRFDFQIEAETLAAIQENAFLIREISKERILIELKKIVEKGNILLGVVLLIESGLFKALFRTEFKGNLNDFMRVKTFGEFFYCLLQFTYIHDINFNTLVHFTDDEVHLSCRREDVISGLFLDFKGDFDTSREIKALEKLRRAVFVQSETKQRLMIFEALKVAPQVANTKVFSSLLVPLSNFKNGFFPMSLKDININGNDIMELGFQGKKIGVILQAVVDRIMQNKLDHNSKEKIITFIKKKF